MKLFGLLSKNSPPENDAPPNQYCGKNTGVWLRIALSFPAAYGLCYLWSLAGMTNAPFSIMAIPVMTVVYLLLTLTGQNLSRLGDKAALRRRCLYAGIISLLFCIAMIMGYQLQTTGLTECGLKGKGLILFRSACLSIGFFPFWNLLFQAIENMVTRKTPSSENHKTWSPRAVFALSAVFVFVCLIPVWLAYYPIIMSYDFHRQVNEAAKGFAWFWPYQPIAHTWVIWLFLQLGIRLDNLEAGMAGMALFQMLVYALTTAYAASFLYRVTKRKWPVIAALMFFALFPLNSVMVICTTKDVLFSVLFLLFALLVAERFFFVQGRKLCALDALILLVGCVMTQFRNNAIYAVAVFGILWVILAGKREKLRVLLLCFLLIAGSRGTSVAIKAAIGTELEAPKVEMYSVPIQQFARVGYYHGEELDSEMWTLLNSCISAESWPEYNPPLADTVKSSGVEFPVTGEGHMKQFLTNWFTFAVRYPNEFLDAFLELTRGYWFPDDTSYAECLGYGLEGRMGIIYTYTSSEIENVGEIAHISKFPWLEEQLEKIVSANAFYQWPVLSVLFKSAFYFWSLCLIFTAFLYLGRRKKTLFCMLPLVYMATILLGPVVQLRYLFPVMLTLPLLFSLLILSDTNSST